MVNQVSLDLESQWLADLLRKYSAVGEPGRPSQHALGPTFNGGSSAGGMVGFVPGPGGPLAT